MKGRVTIPTDESFVEGTKEIANIPKNCSTSFY